MSLNSTNTISTAAGPGVRPRLALLDSLRGFAVVLMAFYHGSWDADFLGLADIPLFTSLPWLALRAFILGLFLLLAGISLTLAHGEDVRWHAFLRRLATVGASALLITACTRLAFDEGYVTFGVLHHIAVASVIGLLVLRLTTVAIGILAAALLVLPNFVQVPAFNGRWLAWTGLAAEPPFAVDHVPLLPWMGIVFIGILVGRAIGQEAANQIAPWRIWRPRHAGGQLTCWLGRHSLVVYLVHQPIIFGILWLLAGAP